MIKGTRQERIARRMRAQVAYFMVEYYHWIRERSYLDWPTDIGRALRTARACWEEHLRKNPLPEYPSA